MTRSILLALLMMSAAPAQAAEVDWPAQTRFSRPWAYNWWMGSAVDKDNLARELARYKEGGLGGIHIVPIYGAKGAQERYIDYLSPKWMEMLAFAIQEAGRLDLGVDMTTGTGWCFGGPQISREQGCWQVTAKAIDFPADGKLNPRDVPGTVLLAVAAGPAGQRTVITDQVGDGRVAYKPQAGQKLVILSAKLTGQGVKRAAPGGAGPMMNPFSPAVMEAYLKPFSAAFDPSGTPRPRAMYHDSFEYSGNWTNEVLEEFPARRGYKLQDQLEAFAGAGDADVVARVKCDYRETLSDLLIEKSFPLWFEWCRSRGILTRDQAHGSPANLIDLYAQADIPETEMFGRGNRDPLRSGFDPERFTEGDRNILVSKFASSAAHLAGRKLVASETCTWMAEHFCETLEEAKCFVDLMLAAGINHVFYHGTVYSPDDAAWPGWLFYASTQMNPRNPIWRDAPALNAYIARCQSVLQAGTSDNDVLLYWPIHDLWHDVAGMNINCSVHGAKWLKGQPIGATARRLWDRGYSFDYVSDRWLQKATVDKGEVVIGAGRYRAIVLPPVQHIPVATMRKLVDLAQAGAKVICEKQLPADVPGLGNLEPRRAELKDVLARAKDAIWAGDLEPLLSNARVYREMLVDQAGVMFIRRRIDGGRYYFIANQSGKPVDGFVPLVQRASAAAILDPMTGRIGPAATLGWEGRDSVELHLEPGQSIIVQTWDKGELPPGPGFRFARPGKASVELKGPWQVKFIAGGPALPKEYKTDKLASWTTSGDPAAEAFAGTALYSTTFDTPAASPFATGFVLDLGKVCHSARVRLNGKDLGTVFMNPYRLALHDLKPTGNLLEIEVTNLAANRIRDLDRRKVAWRVFNEINFVNIGYKPFDASNWPIFESGLIGPVRIMSQSQ